MSSACLQELEALFKRGLDGDAAAYREFLCGTGRLLRRHVERLLNCTRRAECDAEDIVQDVLLAIHSKRHLYERDSSFAVWLHAIARYRVMDFLRATNDAANDIPLQDIEGLTGLDAIKMDLVIAVKEIIAHLPERLRRPIELMKLQGLSVHETADITKMSEAAVRVNVHRGLKALVSALK